MQGHIQCELTMFIKLYKTTWLYMKLDCNLNCNFTDLIKLINKIDEFIMLIRTYMYTMFNCVLYMIARTFYICIFLLPKNDWNVCKIYIFLFSLNLPRSHKILEGKVKHIYSNLCFKYIYVYFLNTASDYLVFEELGTMETNYSNWL